VGATPVAWVQIPPNTHKKKGVKNLKVRHETFVSKTPADAWASACIFGQEKLNEGYTTVLLVTGLSTLAKKYNVPENGVMVRYWGKRKTPA